MVAWSTRLPFDQMAMRGYVTQCPSFVEQRLPTEQAVAMFCALDFDSKIGSERMQKLGGWWDCHRLAFYKVFRNHLDVFADVRVG